MHTHASILSRTRVQLSRSVAADPSWLGLIVIGRLVTGNYRWYRHRPKPPVTYVYDKSEVAGYARHSDDPLRDPLASIFQAKQGESAVPPGNRGPANRRRQVNLRSWTNCSFSRESGTNPKRRTALFLPRGYPLNQRQRLIVFGRLTVEGRVRSRWRGGAASLANTSIFLQRFH